MATLSVIDSAGKAVGSATLEAEWLEREKGQQAVHDTVVAYLAGQRSGTANTRNRSAVSGSGAKPWRQKGTGRARSGTRKSPIWRGGGTVFGPTPRDFSKKINKKVKRLAARRVLAERLDAEELLVLNSLSLAAPKTKSLVSILNDIGAGEDTLVIVEQLDNNLYLAARNLPWVEVVTADTVNVYQLLHHASVVLTQAALERFGNRIRATNDSTDDDETESATAEDVSTTTGDTSADSIDTDTTDDEQPQQA